MRPRASGGEIALAATLHDPEGALLGEIARRLPALVRLYAHVRVASSPPTDRRVRALLAAYGVDAGSFRINARGPLYRSALRAAHATDVACVHYLDFDRALHWVARRPRELAALLVTARRHPLLVIGRTPRAHASHHAALVETEHDAERRFAARLGLGGRVDFLVPSFVLARAQVERFLARSRARGATMYGEWVALLAGLDARAGRRAPPLAYVECDGLDWETPDRYPDEVRRVGRAAWRRAMSTPAEWAMRRALGHELERGCARALRRWPVRVPIAIRRLRRATLSPPPVASRPR